MPALVKFIEAEQSTNNECRQLKRSSCTNGAGPEN